MMRSLFPLLLLAAPLLSCTTSVQQTRDESLYPPEDTRPLPSAPEALPPAPGEVFAEDLAAPQAMALVADELWVTEAQGGRLLAIQTASRELRVVASDLGSPWALAAAGDTAVVSDVSAGRILRLADDGTINILASGQSQPKHLRVRGNDVYWLNEGEADGGSWKGGSIFRAKLDGSEAPEELATNLQKPRCLSLVDQQLYFLIAGPPAELVRLPLSGGPLEPLLSSSDEGFACTTAPDGRLLWATRSPNWPFSGWIRQAASDMQSSVQLTPAQAYVSHVLASDSHVYWAYIDGVQGIARDGSGSAHAVASAVATADMLLGPSHLFLSDRFNGRILAIPRKTTAP